jgi:predicted Zn-dependent protease
MGGTGGGVVRYNRNVTVPAGDALGPLAEAVDPADEHPDFRSGVDLLWRGRNRRAARRFGRWADGSGPDAYLAVAESFAAVLEYDRAVDFLSRLLADQPAHARALELLIECLAHAGRPLEALTVAREAVLRCPGEAGLRRMLAEQAMAQGLRTEALRAAEEGLSLVADDADLLRRKVAALLGLAGSRQRTR